ncbi:MAG: sigma-54-dependent transcriptional regulator [Syntrophobacteraceae bacterium]
MNRFSLFVVDDEESIRKGLSFSLQKLYRTSGFSTAETALEALASEQPNLILLDVGLPAMTGIEALKVIRNAYPEIIVIMVTAFEDIQTVIAAMKLGAYDYVVKPIQMDALKTTINNALQTVRMRMEIQAMQERALCENLPCFIAGSDAIQDVMQLVERVAKSPDAPVLVLGESGTGKELIASSIHYKSPNFRGPFITLNCAAIPGELLESELFGYEKGAFSGAAASGKEGLVEKAAGGTLFLDEVADLSLEAQAKLLRFLESGEYYRLGSTRKRQVRTRVVSATNKDLEALIEEKRFRRDLFYRLSVIKIEVPSLTRRREDIVPLAGYFLIELGRKYGKRFNDISREAREALARHTWKGNVRELRNVIERCVLIENGPEITLSALAAQGIGAAPPLAAKGPAEPAGFPPLPEQGIDLEALEKHFIREALQRARGNDRQAANLLGMSYYAFRYRRKQMTIS